MKDEAYALLGAIHRLVAKHVPELLEQNGVGPDSAAAVLIAAGDNPARVGNNAAFAALCGVSPVEASSGMTTRPRLNRGGDRQANAALYASPCPGSAGTNQPSPTWTSDSPKARPDARRSAA